MNKEINEFINTISAVSPNFSFLSFGLDLVITFVLTYLLSLIYVRYSTALSNKNNFARNFMLLAMTTMLIISIVKSSLALSLGLVGALSIVRFRTAIKEPEELTFTFLSISIGLGLGANQRAMTVYAFIIIAGFLILRSKGLKKDAPQNLYLSISHEGSDKIDAESVVKILHKHCDSLSLKRFSESETANDLSFFVGLRDFNQLNLIKNELQGLSDKITVSFIDNSGVL